MKYNININQKELSKYPVDLNDCAILDYIIVLHRSVSPAIESQRIEGYTWVDFGKILTDNPLLRIKSKGALTPRIRKWVDLGFITTIEKRKNGHKLLYFRPTIKIDSLFIQMNDPIHIEKKPIHSDEKPIHTDEPIIILSIINTKDNILSSFDTLWNLYNYKIGRKKALQKFENIAKDNSDFQLLVENIKKAIPKYLEHLASETWKQQKQFEVWLNAECWNDEYEIKKTGKQSNLIHTQDDKYSNVPVTRANV